MLNVRVRLQPIVSTINLPTVIKTAVLPGDSFERLFMATQTGEIYYTGDEEIEAFLDIRSQIITLGTSNGGYDERGLLGLAFHPDFYNNGMFYLHYSVAGTQGPGALSGPFTPNPCDPGTLNLRWTDRENQYDHIDTVEEWGLQPNGQPLRRRTLLNIRRPFANHNGVNSLNFSPETGRLVLTTGDGGSGYDPFNLAQDDMEIAGKIIEIDVSMDAFTDNPPAVTRFDELPAPVRETLTIIVKGVRNIPGIAYRWYNDRYIKFVGNVGQDLVESVFSFDYYEPLSVPQMIQSYPMNRMPDRKGLINLGWRGWEGDLPSPILRRCSSDPALEEMTIAYYDDAIMTDVFRIHPLTCYYHIDPRPEKIQGTALTGVQSYMGNDIPDLAGGVIFIDFVRKGTQPPRGALAFTRPEFDCKQKDYYVIEPEYDFGPQAAFYTCLGTSMDQSRLFLGTYGSMNVTDFNLGSVFEIVL